MRGRTLYFYVNPENMTAYIIYIRKSVKSFRGIFKIFLSTGIWSSTLLCLGIIELNSIGLSSLMPNPCSRPPRPLAAAPKHQAAFSDTWHPSFPHFQVSIFLRLLCNILLPRYGYQSRQVGRSGEPPPQ